ncbi:MAG: Ldh family oxidoreductase [Microbacterium sp.]
MSASPSDTVLIAPDVLERLCAEALRAAGGSDETAREVARASVEAERRGKPAVGVAHLLDYLDALRAGRMNGDPARLVERPRPASVVVDADEGAAQVAFARALPALVAGARECGLAALSVRRSFSAGELAHYTTRVAAEGFLALAATNSPALMSAYGSRRPIAGTNPLSFALPHPRGPRVFDQASSETAWVSVRDAADRGDPIPSGWALDDAGEPTTDAAAALDGALLPFGGVKGANIATMVEMLAVLAGGTFAVDAAPFDRGGRSPALGLFVLAIDPSAFDPGFADRAEEHHRRLADEHGADFGRRRAPLERIALPRRLHAALGADDEQTVEGR